VTSTLGEIRSACAEVCAHARHVRIDPAAIERLTEELVADERLDAAGDDPAHHRLGDDATTLAFVVTLDAVNFGSGWFPVLRKRDGLSGYYTVATSLRARFERDGSWDAEALVRLDADACADVFGQVGAGPGAAELMALFARSLRDLGSWLKTRWDGRFEGPIEFAGGSAARLVGLLAEMPLYRDVADYGGRRVPFYKRAQITAADLASAFGGDGHGHFEDLDQLTCFADNLVPHVLRGEGVLGYAEELAMRIDGEELIPAGSQEEIELRAGAVHAVELCVGELRTRGVSVTAAQLDGLLWHRGQRPAVKARPRHRTRTSFY
jgi:hypothetical protein